MGRARVSKASRTKGVTGERESADIFRAHGFEVVRLQNNVEDAGDFTATLYDVSSHPATFGEDVARLTLLIDAKRRERLNIWEALAQVTAVARNGQVPGVLFRRNRSPWYQAGLAEDFARLLGQ